MSFGMVFAQNRGGPAAAGVNPYSSKKQEKHKKKITIKISCIIPYHLTEVIKTPSGQMAARGNTTERDKVRPQVPKRASQPP